MIDTHSHLFDAAFSADLIACLKRCQENNVNKIILVGFSKETNCQALDLAAKYPIFYPTVGIHPSLSSCDYAEDVKYLADLATKNKVYAIGECGLDYHYGKDDMEYQKALFRAQIELAVALDLPLVVHTRDAFSDTYEILKDYAFKVRGVMHCYSGSKEMALEFIKLGFMISLGGPVTFKNAIVSKEVAKAVPLDKLLIETDCPYLAPVPYRGKRNESSYVVEVAKTIAEIKNLDLNTVDRQTTDNANLLFRLEESI